MSIRTIAIVLVVVMAFLGGIVWQSQMQKASPPGAETPGGSAAPGGAPAAPEAGVPAPSADANPGLAWKVPANWNTLEARPMRLATYGIPATGGDAEGAECAVFYFGEGQGGSVEDNLDRWVGQFEHASQPERSQARVAGFRVHRVEVKGDYLAPSGPMMQSTGTKRGWALVGAIVEGPSGSVFFKLTGPQRTVADADRSFEGLLRSLRHS